MDDSIINPPKSIFRGKKTAVLGVTFAVLGFLIDLKLVHSRIRVRQRDLATLNKQLNEALQTSNLLLKATDIVGRTLDINEVLNRLVDIAIESTGLDHSNVGLYDAKHNEIVIAASYENAVPIGLRFEISKECPEAVALVRGEWLIEDIDNPLLSPQFKDFMRRLSVESILVHPLMRANRLIGIMCFGSTRKRLFEKRQIEIARGISSQASVAIQNASLYAQTKAELERERHIAEELQRSLLPEELPEIPCTDLGAYYASSTKEAQVGGDFYDIIALPNKKYAIIIGDVSGKGIEAAASTAMVKCIIRTFLHQYPSPEFALSQANSALAKQLQRGIFVTVFCAIYDVATGEITYANAGHPHPCYFDNRKRSCAHLPSFDPAICLLANYNYRKNSVRLSPGSFVVTYTDGTFEARRNREFFGEERLHKVIERSADLPAQKIADEIISECIRFSSGKLEDDIAILVIKRA